MTVERILSISDDKLRSISNDIDPEYVIGIFPVFFGAKDVENLYDLKFNEDDIIIFNEMFLDNECFEYLYTFLALRV